MRIILAATIMIAGSVPAQAQQQSWAHQGATCAALPATISRMAENGFRALDAGQYCMALQVLENAYRTLDSGRMQCGRRWAQEQAFLEMNLLDALDYAGESCG